MKKNRKGEHVGGIVPHVTLKSIANGEPPKVEVPAWYLDTDYNGLVFRPRQAFFALTGAWDNLRRSLKAAYEDSVWAHLAGDTSEPFMGGSNEEIAVKVIDHRGNELMVVRELMAPRKKRSA